MKFYSLICAGLLAIGSAQAEIVDFGRMVDDALKTSGQQKVDGKFYRTVLDQLIQSQDNVIVKFYANWCGPCKKMKQTMASVMKSFNASVLVVDIDVDKYDIPGFRIQSIPHLYYYKNGVQVDQHHSVNEDGLRARIKKMFKL